MFCSHVQYEILGLNENPSCFDSEYRRILSILDYRALLQATSNQQRLELDENRWFTSVWVLPFYMPVRVRYFVTSMWGGWWICFPTQPLTAFAFSLPVHAYALLCPLKAIDLGSDDSDDEVLVHGEGKIWKSQPAGPWELWCYYEAIEEFYFFLRHEEIHIWTCLCSILIPFW